MSVDGLPDTLLQNKLYSDAAEEYILKVLNGEMLRQKYWVNVSNTNFNCIDPSNTGPVTIMPALWKWIEAALLNRYENMLLNKISSSQIGFRPMFYSNSNYCSSN